MIQQLKNSKSKLYTEVKKLVLGSDMAWFYQSASTYDTFIKNNSRSKIDDYSIIDMPFYSHVLLRRAESIDYRTKICSDYWESGFLPLLKEIIAENDLKVEMFTRANVNCVEPNSKNVVSEPHYDHTFKHNNLIIYFNDAGGATLLVNENDFTITDTFEPTEDSIITFSGFHSMKPSKTKRRIILIATYI